MHVSNFSFSRAPLYLDALPRERGTSIFDPLATPGLPSTSAARLSTLQPPIFFPPRPASRESAYETPDSFSSPHSPARGSRESLKTKAAAKVDTSSSTTHPHSFPPSDDFCSEVSEKLKKESERQERVGKVHVEEEEETDIVIDSEPSSATVVENGIVGNGECRSDSLRIVGRTRSLAVSEVMGRVGNMSGSDSENERGRREAMEYSSSQYSEFSPVQSEEGEATAGVGQLEESYMANKQLVDRRSHSSSGSFGSGLNPRTDSRSQASNRSSADSSHLVNGDEQWRRKPHLRLKFHSSSQSIPDDKYFTPAANPAGKLIARNLNKVLFETRKLVA